MAEEQKYDLSVIMPVYNEANSLPVIISKVRNVPLSIQLIMVDDGSSDGSDAVLRKYEGQQNTLVLFHEKNKGKGSAIRTAIPYLKGPVTIIQDSDLETEPMDYLHLIEPIRSGATNVVYGSRILGEKEGIAPRHKSAFYLGGKLVTLFSNLLNGNRLTDINTCYKMMKTDLLRDLRLTCERFEFCTEVTSKLSRRKERIVELPMHYFPRSVAEGKKLGVKDGIQALWTIFVFRFFRK